MASSKRENAQGRVDLKANRFVGSLDTMGVTHLLVAYEQVEILSGLLGVHVQSSRIRARMET